MSDPNQSAINALCRPLLRGQVVPFLGAGANLGARQETSFVPKKNLPLGGELATHLAKLFKYPEQQTARDLLLVSQYVEFQGARGLLYDELREIFDIDFAIPPLHALLASLPELLRNRAKPAPPPLMVTTNYDDLLERALRAVGEPFDVVYYAAGTGQFFHQPHDTSDVILIDKPGEYMAVTPDKRTVVLKIHGAINRTDETHDSYVITENDYLDYLAEVNSLAKLPVELVRRMLRSHFLFLGYSLRDWNLRLILRQVWRQQQPNRGSWAIQLNPSDLDKKFWESHNVKVMSMELKDFRQALQSGCLQKGGST